MMGVQEPDQYKLFYTDINISERVRKDHPLRRIASRVDFEFTYKEVADRYGTKGNVSVPPPVVLKLMLLLIFYNVRSERSSCRPCPRDWIGSGSWGTNWTRRSRITASSPRHESAGERKYSGASSSGS
jgi:hypothetical protein